MCVVNKQFELPEFLFTPVCVDLKYNEISLTSTAGSIHYAFTLSYIHISTLVLPVNTIIFGIILGCPHEKNIRSTCWKVRLAVCVCVCVRVGGCLDVCVCVY